MITFTRIEKFKYVFETEDPIEEKIIKKLLSVRVDGFQYSKLYQNKLWDGYNRFYSSNNTFYAGLLSDLINGLKESDIDEYEILEEIPILRIKNIKLRDNLRVHQKEALQIFFTKNYGIFKVPTRGGKTILSAEAIRLIWEGLKNEVPILFFVDSVDLFDQAIDDITDWLKIPRSDIGTINADGYRFSKINIAMIQTVQSVFDPKIRNTRKSTKKPTKPVDIKALRRKKAENVKLFTKFFKSVRFLIVDEVHEYSSDQRMRVLHKLEHVDFLMGLSATPFRGNNLVGNIKLKGFFHDILYDVPEAELKKNKYLANDKFILISIKHVLKGYEKIALDDLPGIKKYQGYLKRIIFENDKRDIILVILIRLCVELKLKTMVMFTSKEHGRVVSELTGYTFISGNDKKDIRKEAKNIFLKGKGKILLVSNIYKKGITLPEVEVMINADGGLEESLLIQKRGRVLGTAEGKTKALIMDFLDLYPEYFADHSLARLETYEKLVGEKYVEIYDSSERGWLVDVKKSIIKWFK